MAGRTQVQKQRREKKLLQLAGISTASFGFDAFGYLLPAGALKFDLLISISTLDDCPRRFNGRRHDHPG